MYSRSKNENIKQTELYGSFSRGDLLYGLHVKRKPYLALLREKVGVQAVTADDYNNPLLRLLSDAMYDKSASKANLPGDPRVTPTKEKYVAHFRSTTESFQGSCPEDDDEAEAEVLKQACIANFTRSDLTIHFLLDGIRMDDVSDSRNRHYRSFTSYELRYVMDNPKSITCNLMYYLDGKQISLRDWQECRSDLSVQQVDIYNTPKTSPNTTPPRAPRKAGVALKFFTPYCEAQADAPDVDSYTGIQPQSFSHIS